MAWFKVDDKLHSHPKVLDVPLRAMGLWVKAGAYCSDHLTDGYISRAAVRLLGGTPSDAKALVTARLWVEAEGGWLFHDWDDHNPSRAEIDANREAERERKRQWREKTRQNKETGRFESVEQPSLRIVGEAK